MKLLSTLRTYFRKITCSKTVTVSKIATAIQEYYLNRNKSTGCMEELYSKAREEISAMQITRIELKSSNIIITLGRPGLLIGSQGNNIDALIKFLHTKVAYKQLLVEEDKLQGWLLPYYYSDDDLYDIVEGD